MKRSTGMARDSLRAGSLGKYRGEGKGALPHSPLLLTSEMSIELFSKWKVDQLKGFLKRREVILSGRKAELAEKAYYAWKLKLEVAKTTQDEEDGTVSTHNLTAQRYLKFLLISQH